MVTAYLVYTLKTSLKIDVSFNRCAILMLIYEFILIFGRHSLIRFYLIVLIRCIVEGYYETVLPHILGTIASD